MKKAVILAAGISNRLSALNLHRPKVLLEVRGKTLLEKHLEDCRDARIDEVFINLHYLPDQVREFVGTGERWNLRVHFNFESQLLGTAGAVGAFRETIGNDDFLIIYGDNHCTFSLSEVIATHEQRHPALTMAIFEKDDVKGSGVAILDDRDYVTAFIEKPQVDVGSRWVNAGVYAVSNSVLARIPEGVSDFGFHIIPELLREGQTVVGVKVHGGVIAVDTPELLAQAQKS